MSQIIITIADSQTARVINALSTQTGYQPFDINGVPNPETRAQFAKRMIINWIKSQVRSQELQDAIKQIPITDTDVT